MADPFERIRAVLSGGKHKSGEIDTAIALTRAALAEEASWRVEYEATAADPLVSSEAAEAAADKLVRSHATSKRLTAAADRLEPLLAQALHDEHQARIRPAYEKARAERAKLIGEFRVAYPRACEMIVDILDRMRAFDRGTLDGLQVPTGEPRIDNLRSAVPTIIDKLMLPEMDHVGSFLWGVDPNRSMTGEEQARFFARRSGEWP